MKAREIALRKALELLRLPGHRLMLMHVSYGQQEYFVVPGGKISRQNAQAILARPDVLPFDDGLFPGRPQTWKIGHGAEQAP